MLCENITEIKDPRYEKMAHIGIKRSQFLLVPCRKCIPCKINKTSEWSMRLMMELESWDTARFITLTYKNGTTPPNKTLVSEDVTAFFKALRQNLNGRKIKYFACGEYGQKEEDPDAEPDTPEWEKGKRPHYHAIIFGVNSSVEDREAMYSAWGKADEFQWFGKQWQKVCGTVTPDSCSYVAGYCQKKLFGELADEEYYNQGKIPPFQHQSLGIGEDYFLKHMDQYKKDGYILFNGKHHPIPETWKRKFGIKLFTQKYAMYDAEKEAFLIFHPDVNSEEYDYFYKSVGYTMAQDEDFTDLEKQEAYKAYVKSKNNLRRNNTL